MQLILLGTGTPNAEPERSGPSVAVLANAIPYVVDFGPGVVRRAVAAGLQPPNLTTAFLTHLHSDHTAGYADLILTPWVLGRDQPLRVFGPPGLQAMTDHILAAYGEDIRERRQGLEQANSLGFQVRVEEIEPGFVYEDDNVRVVALPANHGSWPALSYRFSTPQRTIVISGDTAPHAAMTDNYTGCDVLLHEVYAWHGFQGRPSQWQRYHAAVHTSTRELAQIAAQVQPGLLVLYHQLLWGVTEEELVREITTHYGGRVVSGRDLDVY